VLLPAILPAMLANSAHAAHPLITEDTDTQGKGRFQVELTTEQARVNKTDGEHRDVTLDVLTLTMGATDSLDVLVTVPYLRLGSSASEGITSQSGVSDTGLDLKWRFYEQGALSLALKPGVTFPTGDDSRGLGTGRSTWSAYLVTTAKFNPLAVHLHLGHVHLNNTYNDRVDIWHASAAMSWEPVQSLKLVVDAGIDTDTNRDVDFHPAFLILGAIYSLRPDLDLDLGIRWLRGDQISATVLLGGLAWRW